MRKDADLEYREEPELDSRKMACLMGLMLFLLVVPFMLYITGVIEVWLMSVLFILVPSLQSQTSILIIPSGALAILLAWLKYRKGRKA